jgi:hypothetical protein
MADDSQFDLGAAFMQDPAFNQKLQSVVGDAINHNQQSAQQAKEKEGRDALKVTYDSSTGEMSLTGPAEYGKIITDKMNIADGVQREYQKMLAQNQQQMQAMQQHPWANTLAQIAAGVSSQSKNPIVRGIGIGAERLNPTMEQLQGQRMGLLGESSKLAETSARIDETKLAHQQTDLYRKAEENRKLASDADRKEQAAQTEADRVAGKEAQTRTTMSGKWQGFASKGAFNEQAFSGEYKNNFPNATDAQIKAEADGYKVMAAQALADKKNESAEKAKDRAALRADRHLDRMEELDHQDALRRAAAKDTAARKGLTGKELDKYADTEAAAGLVEDMRDALEQHPDLFGPFWAGPTGASAAVSRFVGQYTDEDISRVNTLYLHAPALMIKLLHEGARGYAPQQRQWLEAKVPKMSDTPEKLRGKLDFIQQFVEADRNGTAEAFAVNQAIKEGKMSPGEAKAILTKQAVSKARISGTASPEPTAPSSATPKRNRVSLDDINKAAGGS